VNIFEVNIFVMSVNSSASIAAAALKSRQ